MDDDEVYELMKDLYDDVDDSDAVGAVTVRKSFRYRIDDNVWQVWTVLSCGHEIPMADVKLRYCPECGKMVRH